MTACDLAQRLRRGDAAALSVVYRQYVTPVWQYAYRTLGGRQEAADDVTASVFLAMVAAAGQYDPDRATVEAWLFGIARRKLADYLRVHYRHRRGVRQLREMAWPDQASPEPFADQAGREAQQAVAAALSRLPRLQQQVLVWKYCDALSVERIAQRMGRSPKAAENLLYRARQRFRQVFERSAAATDPPAAVHEVSRP